MSAESPPLESGNAADRQDLQRNGVSKHLPTRSQPRWIKRRRRR
jgi:hypothetical protein